MESCIELSDVELDDEDPPLLPARVSPTPAAPRSAPSAPRSVPSWSLPDPPSGAALVPVEPVDEEPAPAETDPSTTSVDEEPEVEEPEVDDPVVDGPESSVDDDPAPALPDDTDDVLADPEDVSVEPDTEVLAPPDADTCDVGPSDVVELPDAADPIEDPDVVVVDVPNEVESFDVDGVLDGPVDGSADVEEFDEVEPLTPAEPAEPVMSAKATGVQAIDAPTPSATANAPTRPICAA